MSGLYGISDKTLYTAACQRAAGSWTEQDMQYTRFSDDKHIFHNLFFSSFQILLLIQASFSHRCQELASPSKRRKNTRFTAEKLSEKVILSKRFLSYLVVIMLNDVFLHCTIGTPQRFLSSSILSGFLIIFKVTEKKYVMYYLRPTIYERTYLSLLIISHVTPLYLSSI